MKYIKTYEKYKEPSENDPKIGDYVVLDSDVDDDFIYIIKNNVGQIIFDISSDLANFRTYTVEYDDPNNSTITIWDSEILYHSKNKEEAEAYLNANKYNL